MVLAEQDQDAMCRALADGDIDFGIGLDLPAPEHEHLVLERRALWRQGITCTVGMGHIHYGRTSPLTLADLAEEHFVLLSRPFGPSARLAP